MGSTPVPAGRIALVLALPGIAACPARDLLRAIRAATRAARRHVPSGAAVLVLVTEVAADVPLEELLVTVVHALPAGQVLRLCLARKDLLHDRDDTLRVRTRDDDCGDDDEKGDEHKDEDLVACPRSRHGMHL